MQVMLSLGCHLFSAQTQPSSGVKPAGLILQQLPGACWAALQCTCTRLVVEGSSTGTAG
jgi:hypothetical protein